MKWFSGMLIDVEGYLSGAEQSVKADIAPVMANIETEFISASKRFAHDVYADFKAIVGEAWKAAAAANPGDLGAAIVATAKASAPLLETAGIKVAESALFQFVASLIA